MFTLRSSVPTLAGLVMLAGVGCLGGSPTATPSAPPAASASPTRTSTVATAASPTVTSTVPPAGSPALTPPGTPTATGGGPVSSATPPAGYASSCAQDVPWGRQVSKPFICLESPAPGQRVARGGTIVVRGYAGGSFESNVVNEVRALVDREPGARVVIRPVPYDAPDVGMPGSWSVVLTIPVTAPVGAARVIAHFDSPRDGSVVAQATVDIVID